MCHVAAQYGQTAILHHLALKWDANMDELDNDGRLPLHWAAYKGFAGAGGWGNARPAPSFTRCTLGASCLCAGCAVLETWPGTAASFDRTAFRERGQRHSLLPIVPAVAFVGFADTLRLLLVLGSSCNLADKEGCTPLHWAAIRGHTEACTVLLQVGPPPPCLPRLPAALLCAAASGAPARTCAVLLVGCLSSVYQTQ